jgi:hypothetical protein
MPALAVVTLQSSADHAWHPTAVARGNPMLAGAPKLPPSERSAASVCPVCLPAPVAATLGPVGLLVPVPARQGRLWPARTGSPTITSGVYKTNMQGNISTVFLRARRGDCRLFDVVATEVTVDSRCTPGMITLPGTQIRPGLDRDRGAPAGPPLGGRCLNPGRWLPPSRGEAPGLPITVPVIELRDPNLDAERGHCTGPGRACQWALTPGPRPGHGPARAQS